MTKFSIVMATWNSANSVDTALQSLKKQTFTDYELIVIDNVSTDKTLDLVRASKIKNLKIICQKDTGLYNALNKGAAQASGEYVHFLHSDDCYATRHVLETANQFIKKSRAKMISGGVRFPGLMDNIYPRVWALKNSNYRIKRKHFYFGWMPPHTGTFFSTDLFSTVGKFDESFKIAADYDWFMRAADESIQHVTVSKFFVHQRLGGLSTTPRNLFLVLKEDFKAVRKNNILPVAVILKRIRKLNQIKWFPR